MIKSITLKPGKESSMERRHPWIFSGAIARADKGMAEGELVQVTDAQGRIRAHGFCQGGSIAVKILAFGEEFDLKDHIHQSLGHAVALRRRMGLMSDDNQICRLSFGEGDSLPGLIIDRYGEVVIVQCHSYGMLDNLDLIVESLRSHLPDLKGVVNKSSSSLHDDQVEDGIIWGEVPEELVALENGIPFHIDWQKGQKTGFFVDQRENRARLGELSKGMKVLNTFCYTGGFSSYALRAGAAEVHSLDSSQRAIDLLERNVELLGKTAGTHRSITADALKYLQDNHESYDIVVLDPPAFAKSIKARHRAVLGYKRLNEMGIRAVKKGGLLMTYSCSQVIDRKLFMDTVRSSCIASGRDARVLEHLVQPSDHLVNAFFPEGEYLKGLILQID